MGTEDFIALPASGDFGNENESNESLSFNETREASSQSSVLECKDNPASIEKVELADNVQLEDMRCIPQSGLNDETQCSESDMEIEDLNNLPDLSKTRSRSENHKIRSEAEYLPVNSVDENILPSREPLQQNELHLRSEDVSHAESKKNQKDLVDNSSFSKTSGLLTLATGVSIENGSAPSHHHGGPRKIHKSDGSWTFLPESISFYDLLSKTNLSVFFTIFKGFFTIFKGVSPFLPFFYLFSNIRCQKTKDGHG